MLYQLSYSRLGIQRGLAVLRERDLPPLTQTHTRARARTHARARTPARAPPPGPVCVHWFLSKDVILISSSYFVRQMQSGRNTSIDDKRREKTENFRGIYTKHACEMTPPPQKKKKKKKK